MTTLVLSNEDRRSARLSMRRLAGSWPLIFSLIVAIAAIGFIRSASLLAGSGPISAALSGRVLMGVTGKMTVGELIAAYPPTAILPMMALQPFTKLIGVNPSELFSALVGAALAGLWLSAFLRAEYSRFAAFILTILLVCNPLFLGALVAGPEAMLALLGAWLFATSAFALRARGSVNDLIACASSIAILSFAGALGGTVAVAALPFLVLAKPSDIASKDTFSFYLVLLFPVAFGLAGFLFVNWMMLQDPFGFLNTGLDLANLSSNNSWQNLATLVLFTLACTPVLVALFVIARGRRPLQAIACALLGTLVLSVLLGRESGTSRSLIEALCPAMSLTAAAAVRWPNHKSRLAKVGSLLGLGIIGGISALILQGRPSFDHNDIGSASEFSPTSRMTAEQQVGRFLSNYSDVLIDGAAHPAVVAARGSADGLITGSDTAFTLALLRKRIETRTVAVASADPARNEDAISRNLPALYAHGEPGFQLIYDRNGWRVWSRANQKEQYP